MGAMKEFGFKIARMLFEERMSVDRVVDYLSIQTVQNEKGEFVTKELDKEWLREQVLSVKRNPVGWGYTYQPPHQGRPKRAPINFQGE